MILPSHLNLKMQYAEKPSKRPPAIGRKGYTPPKPTPKTTPKPTPKSPPPKPAPNSSPKKVLKDSYALSVSQSKFDKPKSPREEDEKPPGKRLTPPPPKEGEAGFPPPVPDPSKVPPDRNEK